MALVLLIVSLMIVDVAVVILGGMRELAPGPQIERPPEGGRSKGWGDQ